MSTRNISILFVCQMISATGAMVLVTLGGIIGAQLSPDPALATLPISIMVVSIAATAIPATMLMRRIGRKAGFSLASMCSVVAVLLAAYALHMNSFALLVFAVGLFGINMAFSQQYRYAAAESVEPRFAPRAISLILLGPIGGAFVGEALVRHGVFLFSGPPVCRDSRWCRCPVCAAGIVVFRAWTDAWGGAWPRRETASPGHGNRSSTGIPGSRARWHDGVRRHDADHDRHAIEHEHS